MYKFEKYGLLMWHNGIPLYIGDRLVPQCKFVLWWPGNWIIIPIVAAIFLVKELVNKKEIK